MVRVKFSGISVLKVDNGGRQAFRGREMFRAVNIAFLIELKFTPALAVIY